MTKATPLVFKVAPHILEDLGLNLYSDLPRVLVEYVANAYDADSPIAEITLDADRIVNERAAIKEKWDRELADWKTACEQWDESHPDARGERPHQPELESQCFPDDVTIQIEDTGDGMSRDDLQKKFLVAGRRRRGRKNKDVRSDGNRILMGRKGLGKLAGFGVARVVTVITRRKGESHATKITLSYDDIINVAETSQIPIREERLSDGGKIKNKGTRVILSKLAYGPTGAKTETISNRVADHFSQIEPEDFAISMNGESIEPAKRNFVYAWPEPETNKRKLVDATFTTDDGRQFAYRYRLRFVGDHRALDAKDRGIRVYVNHRLAAAPSLLGADTNMHGFRMTDYLDGVVHADFIDQQPEDYISTDRQSLKWETPLLWQLYLALSNAIKRGCYDRQQVRDQEKETEVRQDQFTQRTIAKASLSKRETTAAVRIGKALASLHKQGTKDVAYKKQFGEVVKAMGRGDLLAHLAEMAKEPHPELQEVIQQVTRLTAEQRDGFYSYVKGRMDAIKALQKIVSDTDFQKSNNEKELQTLFEKSSWLIDPIYFELLTSNRTEKKMYELIEKELQINNFVPKGYDPQAKAEVEPGGKNTRPDLVFLLGDNAGSQIVIVELKAPNTPLYGEHYRQLKRYIRDVKAWLRRQDRTANVSGILIGSFGKLDSQADDVEWLEEVIEETGNVGPIRVLSISKLLDNASSAHHDLIKLWESESDERPKKKAKTPRKGARRKKTKGAATRKGKRKTLKRA